MGGQFGTPSTNVPMSPPGSYTPLLDPNVVRPSPVHAARSEVMSSAMSVTSPMSRSVTSQPFNPPADEGRISVSIDFGTTFSGVAYGSSRIAAGKVQQILHWPGSFETFRKVPTCLLYDDHGRVLAWGLEAKNASPVPGTLRCEWFKLFLEPKALRDESTVDQRLPRLPPGKRAVDMIVDFLSCLWEYAKEQITREIGVVADLDAADVWLTVPAAWDAKGCDIMREAAITAGLVQASRAGDRNWRDRLRIITEPEAAAVHCAHLTNLHHLKPSQNFMICDAGGGTVDLAGYKVIGLLQNLEIAEIAARSGANCGSLFLDLRFRELVSTLLADHPSHLDQASLAYFMHAFSETDKLAYQGESDDDTIFHFTCFNTDDTDDPSVGLINGELAIPGNLLRREVFDPVVNQVLNLIEVQLKQISQPLDALLLVGGFAGCEYLFKRVDAQFGQRIKVIARPSDADTATARGAAQYGLARRPLVSSVIAPRAYIMKVKLPAETEDWHKRPAYIRENNAGVPICENRLQYLVAKGAILRKGQRIKTKFCKFSATPQDRTFEAVLYTSDSEQIMRYTDEGACTELCKWTVDLGSLPSFQQQASIPQPNGFYTNFELGLSVDSAEVRGVLIYDDQEVGDIVFDFLA
ncbi:actin-like ATPase domain-containing protein [Gautieria morchelliformis]|nr:actin-like ATPase domain-containing protein [Gautieria morchelliformis]